MRKLKYLLKLVAYILSWLNFFFFFYSVGLRLVCETWGNSFSLKPCLKHCTNGTCLLSLVFSPQSAKIFNYAKWKSTCNGIFVVFAAVFIITRLIIFPFWWELCVCDYYFQALIKSLRCILHHVACIIVLLKSVSVSCVFIPGSFTARGFILPNITRHSSDILFKLHACHPVDAAHVLGVSDSAHGEYVPLWKCKLFYFHIWEYVFFKLSSLNGLTMG